MTYSICARDPETGHMGVAVQSCFFAAGAIASFVGRRAAVASQAYPNPYWGIEGRARIDAGEDPADVISDLVARDAGHAHRQWHAIDAQGRIAQFTGDDCVDWAGSAKGPDVSAAGNILAGERVVTDMVAAFLDTAGLPFPERLLAALDAAEAAGGDTRGRQAAGLVVSGGEDWPRLDIRVDDHADPLGELRRLYEVSGEMWGQVVPLLPTRDDFSRATATDEAIEEMEAEMARREAAGNPSRSQMWKRD